MPPHKRLNADIPVLLMAAWAIVCELKGTTKSDRTRQMIIEDLENFIHSTVLEEYKPFQKCIREVLEQIKKNS